MSVADSLAQRTAQLSYIPVQHSRVNLALPSTYFNGPTLHAAGTTTRTTSEKLSSIGQRRSGNDRAVAATISSRRAAKTAADNLAAAQQREKDVQAQIEQAGKNSYSFGTTAPTGGRLPTQLAKGGKPNRYPGGKNYPGNNGYTGPTKGFAGTSARVRITGPGNNSGSPGALGGSGRSGQYSIAYNTSLGSGRNKALRLATSYLGTRYVLGGASHTGIDCSGLVQVVYGQLGFKIPMHSATWQKNNIPGVRTSVANLRPGDLVAWKDGSHIAIYAGGGKIIEAANPQRGTVYRNLWASSGSVIGIRLTLPGDGDPGQAKQVARTRQKAQTKATNAKMRQYER